MNRYNIFDENDLATWSVMERSRGLLRLLRVPPSPHLPAGEPGPTAVARYVRAVLAAAHAA